MEKGEDKNILVNMLMEIVNSDDYDNCLRFIEATNSLDEAVDLYF
jgi:hypothetical protein